MPWTRKLLAELLERAIQNYDRGSFAETVAEFQSHGNIPLSDDGSFDELCRSDNYVLLAYELIECWVNSAEAEWAYPFIQSDEWPDFAQSLLIDISTNSIPAHHQWNNIHTLRCPNCSNMSELTDDGYFCPRCKVSVELISPANT